MFFHDKTAANLTLEVDNGYLDAPKQESPVIR